jgi:hypothetical protein
MEEADEINLSYENEDDQTRVQQVQTVSSMDSNEYLVLELEIKHKHGGFNINYEKATVVWQQFGFGL